MSQRLLVCRRDQIGTPMMPTTDHYDAVLTESMDHEAATVTLWREYFLDDGSGCYFGPWKLRVLDVDVFRQHLPAIRAVFSGHGRTFPDDLWAMYGPDGQFLAALELETE